MIPAPVIHNLCNKHTLDPVNAKRMQKFPTVYAPGFSALCIMLIYQEVLFKRHDGSKGCIVLRKVDQTLFYNKFVKKEFEIVNIYYKNE